MNLKIKPAISVIIGLGNPGKQYERTRHNIGFLILDELVKKYGGSWHSKKEMECAEVCINGKKIIAIKPQTFMNSSGKIMPRILTQGIKIENILVIHDELEKSFGYLDYKIGGSHRGHNGLRSIIDMCGADFMRLRFGIGRPEHKEDVGEYVLSNFDYAKENIDVYIDKAVAMIEELLFLNTSIE